MREAKVQHYFCRPTLPPFLLGPIVLMLLLTMTAICCQVDETNVPNLYVYDEESVVTFLQKVGKDSSSLYELRRNSYGSHLYVYVRDEKKTEVLIVSSDGILKSLTAPASFAYLNDQEEFTVWFDEINEGLHFRDGSVRNVPSFGTFGVDISGNYFFIEVEQGLTEVYKTDEPERSLFLAKLTAREIFTSDKRIYLFDYDSVNYATHSLHDKIICQVFEKGDAQYELKEEVQIPRSSPGSSPFAVLDMDTRTGQVLVLDVRDPPFSFLTALYIFDLNTQIMTKVGNCDGAPLFLRSDIIAEACRSVGARKQ